MGKAEETKARVERAALTLFVARGVAETTTKEIAMAASIAEGTIYRYFLSQVPDGTPNPVNVVREVIAQAIKAGEIPRRNADLAAAAAIGVVMQPAAYKVYGRFGGPLSAHCRY